MVQLNETPWKSEYATGISVIDSQHQKLFELYNAMVYHINHNGSSGVKKSVNELIDYTGRHFGYEEGLMEKYGYEDRSDHMEEHTEFINHVMELVQGDIEGHSRESLAEFAEFLQDWLINHIMVVDRAYCSVIPKNA